jgi:hypothetical protein
MKIKITVLYENWVFSTTNYYNNEAIFENRLVFLKCNFS